MSACSINPVFHKDNGMPHPRAPHSEDDGYEARGSRAFTRFLSGLAAFSVGVFICGACSSYSAGDPSFNMAVACSGAAMRITLHFAPSISSSAAASMLASISAHWSWLRLIGSFSGGSTV